VPPTPPLPPLPPIEVLVPGTITPTKDGGPPKVIGNDTNLGLLYTENFDADPGDVDWGAVNAGLTPTQYQQINKLVLVMPNGGIYVLHRNVSGFGTEPFIAYAPSIGATFVTLENQASIQAKLPTSTPTYWSVNGLGVNPLTGQVAYVIGVNEKRALYIGSGTTFVETLDLTTDVGIGSVSTLSFGFNEWRITTAQSVAKFLGISADGTAVNRTVDFGADGGQQHVPVSTSDLIIGHRSDSLLRITANGAVAGDFTTLINTDVLLDDHWDNRVACDPTGMQILLPWDAGQRGKSPDGGATIVGMPGLPFGGSYAYDYAGGAGAESRWVAARGIVRYSPDFGDTWINKEGNLLTIAPIPSFNIIKVVEY
jgi:hypothetical protein